MADDPSAPDFDEPDFDVAGEADDVAPEPGDDAGAPAGPTADGKPAANVVRRKVVSKRVTPKGGPVAAKPSSGKPMSKAAKAKAEEDDEHHSRRYTPPSSHRDQLPSPWWVPALMFGLLIVGAVIIMANYMGVFGDADNIRLVVGLAFILGGIITATQYR